LYRGRPSDDCCSFFRSIAVFSTCCLHFSSARHFQHTVDLRRIQVHGDADISVRAPPASSARADFLANMPGFGRFQCVVSVRRSPESVAGGGRDGAVGIRSDGVLGGGCTTDRGRGGKAGAISPATSAAGDAAGRGTGGDAPWPDWPAARGGPGGTGREKRCRTRAKDATR
jgi:hypothetical protein